MLFALFDSVPSVEELGALLFAECANHGFQFLFVETLTAIRMAGYVGVDDWPKGDSLRPAHTALAIGCLYNIAHTLTTPMASSLLRGR